MAAIEFLFLVSVRQPLRGAGSSAFGMGLCRYFGRAIPGYIAIRIYFAGRNLFPGAGWNAPLHQPDDLRLWSAGTCRFGDFHTQQHPPPRLQILLGYAAIVLVQSWGVVAEVLKNLTFGLGPEGRVVMEQVGLSPTIVALAYQSGYLILPAVVPIAIWILMNRHFFEGIISSANQGGSLPLEETPEHDCGQLDEIMQQEQPGNRAESNHDLDGQE